MPPVVPKRSENRPLRRGQSRRTVRPSDNRIIKLHRARPQAYRRMNALFAELHKSRRLHNKLVSLAAALVALFWGTQVGSGSADRLRYGYSALFYALPLINTVMMPLATAVLASRIWDIENRERCCCACAFPIRFPCSPPARWPVCPACSPPSCPSGAFLFSVELLRVAQRHGHGLEYSLWTQYTLFYALFFYSPLIGICAAYLWRVEHHGHNWNLMMTMPIHPLYMFTAKFLVTAKLLGTNANHVQDMMTGSLLPFFASCAVFLAVAFCAAHMLLTRRDVIT